MALMRNNIVQVAGTCIVNESSSVAEQMVEIKKVKSSMEGGGHEGLSSQAAGRVPIFRPVLTHIARLRRQIFDNIQD